MKPNEWTVKKIGEVCTTRSGGTPSRSKPEYYQGTIPWVKSGEVNKVRITETEEKITQEAINNSSAKVIPKGTVVAAMYGATAGKVGVLEIDAALNQAVLAISPNEDEILPHYIFHLLTDLLPKKLSLAQGGQANLSAEIIKELNISIPTIKEQEKISKIISEWDSAIDNADKLLLKLKQFKKAQLKKLMLPDSANIKSKTITKYKLSEIFESIRDRASKSNLEVLAVSSLKGLISQNERFNKVIAGKSLDRYIHIRKDDFTFNKGNSKDYPCGRVCLVESFEEGLVPNVYISFRTKPNAQVDLQYLKYYFEIDLLKAELVKIINTGVRNDGLLNLKPEDFFECHLFVPDIQRQKEISEFAKALSDQIQIVQNISDSYKKQKIGLMQQLLTGKKRVKV